MASLTSIGNDAEGTILQEIDGRRLGMDAAGNVVNNGFLTEPAKPSRGSVPAIVGSNIPFNCAISNAKNGTSNLSNVSFQVQDVYGNAIAGVFELDIYLSDSSVGAGITATTPSGGIAALASSGTILGVLTTSKCVRVITNAAGLFVLVITDTAKTAFYPVASMLNGMPAQVGAQLSSASYT